MISKLIVIGWTIFIGYSFLSGMFTVLDKGPADGVVALALAFSILVHFGAWALVAIPTFMISAMFNRKPA